MFVLEGKSMFVLDSIFVINSIFCDIKIIDLNFIFARKVRDQKIFKLTRGIDIHKNCVIKIMKKTFVA